MGWHLLPPVPAEDILSLSQPPVLARSLSNPECIENLHGNHQGKKCITDLWWVPTNQQQRRGAVTDQQTHSTKKQVEILHLGTPSDSPETGRSIEILRIIKPGWGFYVTGELLCMQKAAVLSHSIPVPLLHMVSCTTGCVWDPELCIHAADVSSRLSLPRMTGMLYKLQHV